jgi:uncharacterized protein (AIM24 family)
MALQFAVTKVTFNKTAVVANNGTVSATVDLGEGTLCGYFLPASWSGTAVTYNVSFDGTNFFLLSSGGSTLTTTVAASRYIAIDPNIFRGVKSVQFISGTSETSGPKTITCATRIIS